MEGCSIVAEAWEAWMEPSLPSTTTPKMLQIAGAPNTLAERRYQLDRSSSADAQRVRDAWVRYEEDIRTVWRAMDEMQWRMNMVKGWPLKCVVAHHGIVASCSWSVCRLSKELEGVQHTR